MSEDEFEGLSDKEKQAIWELEFRGRQYTERLELERKQAREKLRVQDEQHNRDIMFKQKLHEEKKSLQKELKVKGLKKIYRDLRGRTDYDLETLKKIELSIKNYQWRDKEVLEQLKAKHDQEMHQFRRQQQRAFDERFPNKNIDSRKDQNSTPVKIEEERNTVIYFNLSEQNFSSVGTENDHSTTVDTPKKTRLSDSRSDDQEEQNYKSSQPRSSLDSASEKANYMRNEIKRGNDLHKERTRKNREQDDML